MIGNVIVGQSGGPTAVINSSLAGVYKTAKDKGVKKVYGMLNGIQGLLEERYIELEQELKSQVEVELLKRTPSSYLGSCRYKLPDAKDNSEVYDKIFQVLKKLEVEYFFYIGGNDSMDTIMKLSKYAASIGSNIRFMGVPKTIDNDLEATDHTPGYGSAAKYIAGTTKELIRDSLVYDQKNLTIIEIMGRNVGWLTGAAALSKGDDCEGPDMIFLPELAFDMDDFMLKLEQLQKVKKSVVIAISEGIHLADGRYVCELVDRTKYTDNFGHTLLSGSGNYLANKVSTEFGCKARAIELNTIQRSASHLASLVDINEAFLVGGAAVSAAIAGETGKMIILKRISTSPYQCITDVYDINKIANLEKKIPAGWIGEDGISVTNEFLDYARPLIQGELTPYMVDGLPRHLVYSKKKQ
ncbi:6-phosphofructokinase [Anaerocolumna aminovalerica]|uniref:Pyrophosphate--fructose 6-phosphate 1-phosphotransferase n=1 Tax=Anaerocolumna aminovalerica TaxID=1527 RepID=A0A1I5I7R0_9FIRM|nr:6-phosphofructokinase [Anaerocolumna aminovalerica]MBU5332773.1 6-phosphofructokinase [Anaerocolumna aminovalerica]SFO56180.1 6-phosphofructokinase 1 [Anaerocolumna aminovalerica]